MRGIFLPAVLAAMLYAAEPPALTPEKIGSRFATVKSKNEDRALQMRRLFADAGCTGEHYSEIPLRSSKQPNIICVLPGDSKQTVVIAAHYDRRIGPGEGAIDNWTGASLLPSLFETLRAMPRRRYTYEFAAFTDEERGLIGSREYVLGLSKEHRAEILLAVNIDCIGLKGPIRLAAERTDPALMSFAAIVGDRTGIPVGADVIGPNYDSDASPFQSWRIPAIDFHSLTRDTIPLLHSKQDVAVAVDTRSLYTHYRFIASYLAYIDASVELDRTKPGYPAAEPKRLPRPSSQ